MLATTAYMGYGHLSTRAKNATTITNINHLIKSLEVYRIKRGIYPLQKYANTYYTGTVSSTDTDIDGESGEKSIITLILNKPESIKQLKDIELPSQVQQSSNNPNFHGIWSASGFTYRPGYLDYGPHVTAASQSQVRHPQDWDHYADYISKLFHGIELPSVYSNDNRLTVQRKGSHGGKERGPMGATYLLLYRKDSGNLSVFLSYVLQSNTQCGDFNAIRRTYGKQDDITTCTIQIAKENIGKNISGY